MTQHIHNSIETIQNEIGNAVENPQTAAAAITALVGLCTSTAVQLSSLRKQAQTSQGGNMQQFVQQLTNIEQGLKNHLVSALSGQMSGGNGQYQGGQQSWQNPSYSNPSQSRNQPLGG